MSSESIPPVEMSYSPALVEALRSQVKGPLEQAAPDEILSALARVYNEKGEAPFDPFNASDMLARACVIAEAHD